MNFQNDIKEYIECEIETLRKLDVDAINEALNLLMDTAKKHKRIFVFGNGGSSATASHIQNDFGKGVSEYVEDKFRVQCLNDNIATLMAVANDIAKWGYRSWRHCDGDIGKW
jgi:D-sedoheptulose 7-phosphate isomerase